MIAKLALLLLIFLAVLAILGKWAPRLPRLTRRETPPRIATRTCTVCGRLLGSDGRCDCGQG